ncbi:MAG: MsnO8 family LLM class oxidoreductase [Acidipropionibacterium sp.]|nr:MsnO8 family LLM class oxidoreductase [Acidipropionibacterium sp.]
MRLGVLEQLPLFEGHTPPEVFADAVRLARGVEDAGYHRFWVAEHHNTDRFLSTAPDLVMTHLLEATSRIRVGSGGVMAMHYGSLQLAERFATMTTIFGDRVDMGLGRAPGGDMLASYALNQGRVIHPDSINALIDETLGMMRGELPKDHPYRPLTIGPSLATLPQFWLLGSSGQSAAWAGEHAMNYAYAQFFTGRQSPSVMDRYRAHLPAGTSGQTLSALSVSAAPTERQALEQALPAANLKVSLQRGLPMRFLSAEQMDAETREDLASYIRTHGDEMIAGSYDQVAERIAAFQRGHGVDEVMLVSYIADVDTKIAMYRELASRLS